MTVSVQTPINTYYGNGSTKVFPYTFLINLAADLEVYLDDVLQTTGYSVSNVGTNSGGNVTFTAAPANNVVVKILRSTAISRATDYITAGPLDANTLDADIDRVVMMIQDLRRDIADPNGTVLDLTAVNAAIAQLRTDIINGTVTTQTADKVNIISYGADPSATNDSTSAIQSAIDNAAGKMVLIPAGTYIVTSLSLPSNTTLIGVGKQSVLKMKDNQADGTWIVKNSDFVNGNHNIRLLDFTLDGNMGNQTLGFNNTCTQFRYVTDLLIQNMYITGGISEGVYVMSSYNVLIDNNTFKENGPWHGDASGVHLDGCNYAVLTNNQCLANGFHGIILTGVTNSVIANNVCEGNGYEGMRIQYSSSFNTITANTSTYNGRNGIYLTTDSDQNVISSNVLSSNVNDGIAFNLSKNNRLTGNQIRNNGGYGVEVVEVTDVSQWSNNDIANNTTDNYYDNGSGAVQVWGETLQTVSDNGATTSNAISITNTTDSSSTSTGALKVSGGLGVAKTIVADKLGLSASVNPGNYIYIGGQATGDINVYSMILDSEIQSDVTARYVSIMSKPSTAAASFTLPLIEHFYVTQNTFGAGSTVTTQRAFSVSSSYTGATNNIGFYGNIPNGTGRYNLYMNGTAYNFLAGRLGIGSTTLTSTPFRNSLGLTGATSVYGNFSDGQIQSDVTSLASYYWSSASTVAESFTLTDLRHFQANQGTFGAGSTVTNQYGFLAANTLIGATNNYGFNSSIAAGTGRWNFYAAGTANNYFAGRLGLGNNSLVSVNLRASNGITGSTGSIGILSDGQTKSDVTSQSSYFYSNANTEAAAFTLTSLHHYYATQGTIGAGSTVTNQYGHTAASSLTGATNNYGFYGAIGSGTGKWNFYAAGTAANHFTGATTFGTSVGYGTTSGVGGTVTQATSKSTGVTLNKICGQITMNNAALAASTSVVFTLTNSTIAATDVVIVNISSGGTAASYIVGVDAVAAGSCSIHVRNVSGGSLSEALVLNYAVIKAVNA